MMVRLFLSAALVLLLTLPAAGWTQETLQEFDNPEQRERYYELLEEIRCLVCQNESLASSGAGLADDLRNEVYRLVVEEGRSNEAAIEFLTDRYGDFVLYRPPFQPTTWLLWIGPFAMLLVGAGVLAVIVRHRRQQQPEAELTDADRARAERLLREDDHGDAE